MNNIDATRHTAPPFRSAGLPPGYFGRVGGLHLHVDGAGQRDFVVTLLRELQAAGARGKLNAITDALIGPQRKELASTYASHTPGTGDTERFEYFSTIETRDRDAAIEQLRWILPRLAAHDGIVVEVERVVYRIDTAGVASSLPEDEVAPLQSLEVGFERSPTLPFEIHHAFDIPKPTEESRPPIALRKIMDDTVAAGLPVGGWYHFEKADAWAYRSNAFATADALDRTALSQHAALKSCLIETGLQFRMWSIIEQVLGVWRTPLRRSR